MHILTKVFVVLVAVLSIALTALVISNAANQQNYKSKADALSTQLQMMGTTIKSLQADLAQAQAGQTEKTSKYEATISDLQATIRGLRTNVAEAQTKYLEEQNKSTIALATVARQEASIKQLTDLSESQQKELADRRADLAKQESRLVALGATNADLMADKESLRRLADQLRADNAMLVRTKGELQKRIDALPQDARDRYFGEQAPPPPSTGPLVEGQITRIDNSTGQTLVEINLGKADGVTKDTIFRIHRGGKFLGNLEVIYVDDRAAVGKVIRQQAPLQVLDAVQTGGV